MRVHFQEKFFKKPYRVHVLLFLMIIAAGFIYDGPVVVLRGLFDIFAGPDILVTDYIYIGGFGAALANAGLSGLLAVAALAIAKHEPVGLTMGTLGLVLGLGFFGKNPANMFPIILGGFAYAKYAKLPYGQCLLRAVLATCLAPAVTMLIHLTGLHIAASVAIGIFVGLLVGFLINPMALHMEKAHKGNNIYNVGFTAGFIGMIIVAVYSLMGVDFVLMEYWSTGYDLHLAILLGVVSVYFILCGVFCDIKKLPFKEYFSFHKSENDYFTQFRENAYIHMGIMGLGWILFMLLVQGEYNGPVIGAILSAVGFGAFAKALRSIVPLVIGAMLAAFASQLLTGTPFNSNGFLVAAVFSTCLAPLVKNFGFRWGLVAGFVHLSFAASITAVHGGLNLYNNGFAGGLTAMVLLPIITMIRKEDC